MAAEPAKAQPIDWQGADDLSAATVGLAEKARDASRFLKALAHESRLLLLCLLSEKERSVGELEAILSLRQPTVSQQLARLRLEGFVATRRDGKTVYYSLANDDVRRVIGVVYDIFCGSGQPGPA
jgi:DNA-binding transcriptional ArsR family regulator